MITVKNSSIAAMLTIVGLISSCQPQNHLLLYGLFDRSKSGIERKDFFSKTEKVCHELANSTRYGDRALWMGLDARRPLFVDTSIVRDPDSLHRACNDLFNDTVDTPGSAICPYLQILDKTLKRPQNQDLKPFIVAAIHTNEGEGDFCDDTLMAIVDTVEQQDGKVVIASWTDQAEFNYLLQGLLGDSAVVNFCPDPECAVEELHSLRESEPI